MWIKNATVSGYFIAAELKEMRHQVALLRGRRRAAAVVHFKEWAARRAWPCPLVAVLEAWGLEASRALVSAAHMGRYSKPLTGFGDRWALGQLGALGYRIEGAKGRERVPTNKRNEWGETVYTSRTVDVRIVQAPNPPI